MRKLIIVVLCMILVTSCSDLESDESAGIEGGVAEGNKIFTYASDSVHEWQFQDNRWNLVRSRQINSEAWQEPFRPVRYDSRQFYDSPEIRRRYSENGIFQREVISNVPQRPLRTPEELLTLKSLLDAEVVAAFEQARNQHDRTAREQAAIDDAIVNVRNIHSQARTLYSDQEAISQSIYHAMMAISSLEQDTVTDATRQDANEAYTALTDIIGFLDNTEEQGKLKKQLTIIATSLRTTIDLTPTYQELNSLVQARLAQEFSYSEASIQKSIADARQAHSDVQSQAGLDEIEKAMNYVRETVFSVFQGGDSQSSTKEAQAAVNELLELAKKAKADGLLNPTTLEEIQALNELISKKPDNVPTTTTQAMTIGTPPAINVPPAPKIDLEIIDGNLVVDLVRDDVFNFATTEDLKQLAKDDIIKYDEKTGEVEFGDQTFVKKKGKDGKETYARELGFGYDIDGPGEYFDSLFSNYRPQQALSSLLLNDAFKSNWIEETDKVFAQTHLGIDYWTSDICRKEFDVIGEDVGVIEAAPGLFQLIAHPEGEISEALPMLCDEEDKCLKGTCRLLDKQCVDDKGDTNPRNDVVLKEYVYKITVGVTAPADEDLTPNRDEEGAVSFNVVVRGKDRTGTLFTAPIALKNGKSFQQVIIDNKAAIYDEVCIVFTKKAKGYDGKDVDRVCNDIVHAKMKFNTRPESRAASEAQLCTAATCW